MYENPAANDEEAAERPVEHLPVAERGQVAIVVGLVRRRGHEEVSGRPIDPRSPGARGQALGARRVRLRLRRGRRASETLRGVSSRIPGTVQP